MLDEQIMAQRPIYDKTRIGYAEGEYSKGSKVTEEPDLVSQQPEQQEDSNKEVPNQIDELEQLRK